MLDKKNIHIDRNKFKQSYVDKSVGEDEALKLPHIGSARNHERCLSLDEIIREKEDKNSSGHFTLTSPLLTPRKQTQMDELSKQVQKKNYKLDDINLKKKDLSSFSNKDLQKDKNYGLISVNSELPNSMLKKIEDEIQYDPINHTTKSHDCDLQNHIDE